MNKYVLPKLGRLAAILTLALSSHRILAQTKVTVNGTTITNYSNAPWDLPPFQWDVSMRQIIPRNLAEAKVSNERSSAESRGKINAWLEYGDGGFSLQNNNDRTLGTVKYPLFLRAIPLYDTSKGKDETIVRSMLHTQFDGGLARTSDNDLRLIEANEGIKITPSNTNFVPGEPLDMAITYKLFRQQERGASFYAVVYYNNSAFFETLDHTGQNNFKYSSDPSQSVPNVRFFEGLQAVPKTTPSVPAEFMPKGGGLASFAMNLALSQTDSAERNFFITLKAKKSISGYDENHSTTITVLLLKVVDSKITEVGRDVFSPQLRFTSFDPNHLTQLPRCLLLPKKAQPLSYRLQFQNLGKGPADAVKLVFKRAPGLANAALTLQSFNYGGKILPADAALFTFRHAYNATDNIDTFLFEPILDVTGKPKHTLKGTIEVPNALTNPATMGEVNFTIMAPATIEDNIVANANIYFHSQYGSWEAPVPTNTETTVYREKECQCNNTCKDGSCYIILGLCWWWWALILLVLLLLIWLLRRRRP